MLCNIITGGLMLWLGRKYKGKEKPGAMFAIWLVLAGVGRVIIETWRPDQPKIGNSGISFTLVVAALMALVGVLILLYLYKVIKLPFLKEPREDYFISDGFPMPEEQSKKNKEAEKKKASSRKKK